LSPVTLKFADIYVKQSSLDDSLYNWQ